jgi:DNA repair exonuclease SbcCD nuclease subunit
MKGFLISDIHLGIHKNEEDKWLDITKNYFFGYFFPLLDKRYKQGDEVFILGDLFDNREYISIKTFCYAYDIFDEFQKRNIPVNIIIGNHDMYANVSYEYNSLRLIEKYENVTIYKEPTIIDRCGRKILMLPWIESVKNLNDVLKQHKANYVFCHSDLAGAKSNANVTLTHGINIAEFATFGRVYAGHIHIRQRVKNFQYVGSPYHLDRNDKGNEKGVFILDFQSDVEEFIINDYSPEYKTVEIHTEKDLYKLEELVSNDGLIDGKENWIDIVINNSLIIKNKDIIQSLERLSKGNNVASLNQIDDINRDDVIEDINLDDIGTFINVTDVIIDYVKKQPNDVDIKSKILEELKNIISETKNI